MAHLRLRFHSCKLSLNSAFDSPNWSFVATTTESPLPGNPLRNLMCTVWRKSQLFCGLASNLGKTLRHLLLLAAAVCTIHICRSQPSSGFIMLGSENTVPLPTSLHCTVTSQPEKGSLPPFTDVKPMPRENTGLVHSHTRLRIKPRSPES